METVAWHSLEGQAIELGWIRENVLELADADYLTMVLKKTCWLATIHPARIGALIGSRGRSTPNRSSVLVFFSEQPFRFRTIC